MEINNKTILLVVAGGLLLNVMTYSKIGTIRQEIRDVSNSNINYIQMIDSNISHLNTRIFNMMEEKNWVSSREITPDLENSKSNEILLNLEFSLKEVEDAAKVKVLYKADIDESWTEISAINTGGNIFQSTMNLENKENYKYQIVAYGNRNISSELYYVEGGYTRPSPLRLISDSLINISTVPTEATFVFAQYGRIFEFHKVKSAVATVYNDGIREKVIELEEKPEIEVMDFSTEIGSNTKITLKVEYMDGSVHEGQLYPTDQYGFKYYY